MGTCLCHHWSDRGLEDLPALTSQSHVSQSKKGDKNGRAVYTTGNSTCIPEIKITQISKEAAFSKPPSFHYLY